MSKPLAIFTILSITGLLVVLLVGIFNTELVGTDTDNPLDRQLQPITSILPVDNPNQDSNQPAKIRVVVDGNEVLMNDFSELPNVVNRGLDFYHLQGNEQKPYSILYKADNASFAISLEESPFDRTHTVASEALVELLGITETEACYLNVYVGVPAAIDSEAEIPETLSFCE